MFFVVIMSEREVRKMPSFLETQRHVLKSSLSNLKKIPLSDDFVDTASDIQLNTKTAFDATKNILDCLSKEKKLKLLQII